MQIEIKHIYCGQEKTIDDGKRKLYPSSYQKESLDQSSYEISETGFVLDHQSDQENHGGVDKAVCVYSLDNYQFLEEKYGIALPACAFGENLSIVSVDDSEVCLGDRFACGEVVFEVSQPRQPCWKISSIVGIKNLTALVVKEHRTGFYFRVLKAGKMTPSDKLELISRDYPKFTIEFINQIAFNAKENQERIREVLACDRLALAYWESLQRRYKGKEQGLQEWQRDGYH